MKFGSIHAVGQVVATGSISSNTTTLLTGSGQLTNLGYATTGSNVFTGTQTISGSIVPSVTNTYDLGSSTHQFRHVYISSGSLYIDGTKVLGSSNQELQITTDIGQSFKILESGSDTITLQSADGNVTLTTSGGGDVIMDPSAGIIALKGTTTVYSGYKILSSDGNNIQFGNGISITGSIVATGTSLVSGSSQISELGYSTTGSNTFQGTQTVNGSLVITGSITAQQYIVSSSVTHLTTSFSSGSTKFGDSSEDTHQFTGSVYTTGSLYITSSSGMPLELLHPDGNGIRFRNSSSSGKRWDLVSSGDNFVINETGVSGRLFISSSGNFGFNTNSPSQKISIVGGATSPGSFSGGNYYVGLISGSVESFAIGTDANFVYLQSFSSKPLKINNQGNNVIFDGGSVAIGKSSPNATLDINGNTLITGSLGINAPIDSLFGTTMKRTAGSSGVLRLIGNDNVVGNSGIHFYNDNTTSGSYISMYTTGGLNLNGVMSITNTNVGIGTSVNNSWSSNARVLQIGAKGVVYNDGFNNLLSANNSYFDGTNNVYLTTGYATRYYQEHSSGEHIFQVAPSGTAGTSVSYTSALTIANSRVVTVNNGGLVLNGTGSDSIQTSGAPFLYLSGGGSSYTTIQQGSTKMRWWQFNGSSWIKTWDIDYNGNATLTGTFTENSSIRYKENVETVKYGLDKVLQMRGVTYNKKDNGIKELGVIAEEINEILPEVVLKNEQGEVDSVSYGRITAVLIEAIKDLKQEIEELKLNK